MRNIKITSLAGVIALFASLLLVPNSHAATPPDSCFDFDTNTGTILEYYGHEDDDTNNPACTKEVDIPAQIGGDDVVIIGDSAFNVYIDTVTFPATVTTIGDSAFEDNDLTTLVLPDTITSIGVSSFQANQLTSLTLSNSLVSIPNNAFTSNELTTVVIPSSVTTIGTSAFSNNQLSSLVIPGTVATLGNNAFYSNNLSSLTISEGVTSLGHSTFRYNQLATLVLPNSVLSVGLNTFANNQLTSVTFGNAHIGISQGSFAFNRLASVVVPNTVTGISRHAFAHQTPGMDPITARALVESNDPADWAQVRSQIEFTRVYTASPSNPNGLVDGVSLDLSSAEYPGSGVQFITGGHLINPAALTVGYVDEDGQSLQGSEFLTGQLSNDGFLGDYFMLNGPAVASTDDETTIAAALSAYYRLGDVVSIQPVEVDGYDTPDVAPFTLTGANNQQNIVYSVPGSSVPGGDVDGDAGDEVLPETGASLYALLAGAVGMVGAGAAGLVRLKKQL